MSILRVAAPGWCVGNSVLPFLLARHCRNVRPQSHEQGSTLTTASIISSSERLGVEAGDHLLNHRPGFSSVAGCLL
jgi:hypothetical protein